MSYTYKILTYDTYHEELRTLLGVTAEELTDDDIDMLPNGPTADLEVSRLIPSYATVDGDNLFDLRMATLYLTAANCLPALKVKLLIVEDDGHTKAQRFPDAMKLKPEDLRLKGLKFIDNIPQLQTGGLATVFDVVRPAIDPITGNAPV